MTLCCSLPKQLKCLPRIQYDARSRWKERTRGIGSRGLSAAPLGALL